jgi:hypothetical protein
MDFGPVGAFTKVGLLLAGGGLARNPNGVETTENGQENAFDSAFCQRCNWARGRYSPREIQGI